MPPARGTFSPTVVPDRSVYFAGAIAPSLGYYFEYEVLHHRRRRYRNCSLSETTDRGNVATSTYEKRRESSFPGREIRWVLVPLTCFWQGCGQRSRGAAGIAERPCPPRSCLVASALSMTKSDVLRSAPGQCTQCTSSANRTRKLETLCVEQGLELRWRQSRVSSCAPRGGRMRPAAGLHTACTHESRATADPAEHP